MDIRKEINEIKGFKNLELLAHQVVEGFISGLHKSPFHGFSAEFAEHRLYNQGESNDNLNSNVFFQVKSGFSGGYNGRKIYFGGTFKYNYNSDKAENNTLGLQPIKNSFHLFFD